MYRTGQNAKFDQTRIKMAEILDPRVTLPNFALGCIFGSCMQGLIGGFLVV